MSYIKLLSARKKSDNQPTMEPTRFSAQEKERASRGDCVRCGTSKAGSNSYICDDCQGLETIDDIRNDIKMLRKKILKRQA